MDGDLCIGRCAGEVLGRAEAYLITVALIQQFKFKSAIEHPSTDFGYTPGVNMYPKEFSAIIEPRF